MHARQLPARAGQSWLREAYQLYRKNPPLLISAAMAYLLVGVGIGLLPFVGSFLLPLIQPMLTVLLANVCGVIALSQLPTQASLLRTLAARRPALLQLGGLNVAITIGCTLLATLLANLLGAPANLADINEDNIHAILLPMVLFMIPVFFATWFAPLLTAWHDVQPAKAMFFSVVAVWRNLRAFFVFFMNVMLFGVILPSLVLIVLGMLFPGAKDILQSLMQFILLMTLLPILLSCAFISYRQVFAEEAAPPASAPEQSPDQAGGGE